MSPQTTAELYSHLVLLTGVGEIPMGRTWRRNQMGKCIFVGIFSLARSSVSLLPPICQEISSKLLYSSFMVFCSITDWQQGRHTNRNWALRDYEPQSSVPSFKWLKWVKLWLACTAHGFQGTQVLGKEMWRSVLLLSELLLRSSCQAME